jgi:hypothetical protein
MSAARALLTEPPVVSFARARQHAAEVESMLVSQDMSRKTHSDIEQMLDEQGRRWAQMMFQQYFDMRAAAEKRTEVVGSDGVERTSVRPSQRHLQTLLGRVEVPRLAYQAPGSVDLHPMDGSLNLPQELYSHGLRRLVAKEAARASFDEVVEMVRDYTGSTLGKRQVEQLTIRAAQDFDAFYEHRASVREPKDDLLILSTDGKGVVMRHKDLREPTKRAAEKSKHKLETRLSPGEKANRKRMAQVATVYSVAPYPRSATDIIHGLHEKDSELDTRRPRPVDKRVWASVDKTQGQVIGEMFAEALRRDPAKQRRWVVLLDGEPKQLRAVKTEARRIGVKVTLLLDIVHVLEYLWDAARALFAKEHGKAESWVADRLRGLLTGRSGGDVAGTIRWWAARNKKLGTSEQQAVDKTCDYLSDRTRTRMMHYQEALREGLPIATGVIEGACRYLVKDRMDRTGARWGLTGAEAVLRLRALRASGDFDEYWTFHTQRDHERNHASNYKDAQVPEPITSTKPRLRRVK